MNRKYKTTTDNEWCGIRKRGFRLACCGCGLTHVYNYRINKKGQLERQVFLDPRATGAIRRYMSLDQFEDVSAVIQKKIRAVKLKRKRKSK